MCRFGRAAPNVNGDFISGPTALGEKAGFLVEAFELLAVALGELGLIIPGIDLARPAIHEEPDDRLRARGAM